MQCRRAAPWSPLTRCTTTAGWRLWPATCCCRPWVSSSSALPTSRPPTSSSWARRTRSATWRPPRWWFYEFNICQSNSFQWDEKWKVDDEWNDILTNAHSASSSLLSCDNVKYDLLFSLDLIVSFLYFSKSITSQYLIKVCLSLLTSSSISLFYWHGFDQTFLYEVTLMRIVNRNFTRCQAVTTRPSRP